GIRDFHVTGVQTCALPIFTDDGWRVEGKRRLLAAVLWAIYQDTIVCVAVEGGGRRAEVTSAEKRARDLRSLRLIFRKLRHGEQRSEERRVGKEWRSRRATA